MRQSWTDDRLDDLSRRMDERFDQVDRRFEEVDRRFEEVDKRFEEVDRRFDKVEGEMKAGFKRIDREIGDLGKELREEIAGSESRLHARLDRDYVRIREEIAKVHNDTRQMNAEMHAFQRTLLQIGGGMLIALVVTLASLVATNV